MIEWIFKIILVTIITERLLDGLHNFYWTVRLKKDLIGDQGQWASQGAVIEKAEQPKTGILPDGALREYIRCIFCQSWAVSWAVSFIVLLLWDGLSWHWVWMGLVAGWLSNKSHDLGDALKRMGT